MQRKQLLLILAAVVLVVVIFLLPKAVVKKDAANTAKAADSVTSNRQGTASIADAELKDGNHGGQANPEAAANIERLKGRLAAAGTSTDKTRWADSLSQAFYTAGRMDSAAVYKKYKATITPGSKQYEKAAESYFEAASFAIDAAKRQRLTTEAQELFDKALAADPDNLEAKAKKAMTYVDSENPMQAIGLLREVLAKDPNNELAIYNLGTLSLQSRQFDKAASRFEMLTKLNPKNAQAWFYLAVANKELGNNKKALECLAKVKQTSKDPNVLSTATEYEKQIKG